MRMLYSDEDVLQWAEYYISSNEITLRNVAEEFKVPLSTIYYGLRHRLIDIDYGVSMKAASVSKSHIAIRCYRKIYREKMKSKGVDLYAKDKL